VVFPRGQGTFQDFQNNGSIFHFFVGARLCFSVAGPGFESRNLPHTPLELRFIVIERLSRTKTLDEKTSGYILARKFGATRFDNGFDALS